MVCASIGLCVNRGATDEKLVLIHDVQSYIYIQLLVRRLWCSRKLSPWLLASAMIQPAQSLIARSFERLRFGTVGLDRRNAQWGIAES
jgi:Ni/Fe-hydrogenase subunit HybB-like protein